MAAACSASNGPLTSPEQLDRVVALVDSGADAEAVQLLHAIVAGDAFAHKAFYYLAILALNAGDVSGARDAIDRALLIQPATPTYQLIRAETLRRSGRLDEARAEIAEVLAKEPDNHEALTSAGLVESDDADAAAAEAFFRRAISIKDDYLDAIYNLARLKARAEDAAEAEQWLSRARALRPQDPRFHVPIRLLAANTTKKIQAIPTDQPKLRSEPSYAELSAALRSGSIVAEPNVKILGAPSSPIFSASDANQIFAPLGILAAAILWYAPIIQGLIAAALLLVVYEVAMPRYVARKLRRRIVAHPIAANPVEWDRIWKTGGIALLVRATGRRIQAPDENWREALFQGNAHPNA